MLKKSSHVDQFKYVSSSKNRKKEFKEQDEKILWNFLKAMFFEKPWIYREEDEPQGDEKYFRENEKIQMNIISNLEDQEKILDTNVWKHFEKSHSSVVKLEEKHQKLNFKYISQTLNLDVKKREHQIMKTELESLKLKIEKQKMKNNKVL